MIDRIRSSNNGCRTPEASVPFPLRFLFASQPKIMGKALGIVYRTIATHLAHKAGYKKSTGHTGAVTLIQRFGSALNLNIHFHMLFLDGVYVGEAGSSARFRWVKAPTSAELTQLTHTIAHRLGGGLCFTQWASRQKE